MRYATGSIIKVFLLAVCFLSFRVCAFGQNTQSNIPGNNTPGQLPNTPSSPAKDTNANKSNTKKWKDEEARISFVKLGSDKVYKPDTALHTFDRRPFLQPWYRDQGNLGSPVSNLFFTPEDRLGPTLGYHVFDVYRFLLDSLNYYNTTRPYAAFSYQLGSKLEQMARILYTQNIKPWWNFSVDYYKINSPGYYKIQRNNHDNGSFTTNYKSRNKHYELYGALIYNKQQHDENGGVANASQLSNPNYNDRRTLDVNFADDYYSITRSTVTNMQRDFTVGLQHSYTWGHVDTSYNSDSTQYFTKLIPRFRITHKFSLSTEMWQFKDLSPDSARYAPFFEHTFYQGDSVFTQQKWFWVDNQLLLNGFIGNKSPLAFNVGAGNRFDEFITAFHTGLNRDKFISNYVTGEIKKEALQPGQWEYSANAKLFVTGNDAGDFLVRAALGKSFKDQLAALEAGFSQQLNSAPYNYTFYENQFYTFAKSFDKESITQVYGTLQSPRLRLSLGIRNYVIDNYIYINQQLLPAQDKDPFNLTQVWLRKIFRLGIFYLDNELAYQQPTANAPVNIPALLGRHRLSVETNLFHQRLKIATGIEVRYNTAYDAPGYDPFLMRFYYQNSINISNVPEGALFFDFRIKRFRAYVMGDQLQTFFTSNNINYPGYPAQDAMLRFGFTWVMIN